MEKKVLQQSVPEHHQLLELLMEHLLFCLRMCKSTVVLTQYAISVVGCTDGFSIRPCTHAFITSRRRLSSVMSSHRATRWNMGDSQ